MRRATSLGGRLASVAALAVWSLLVFGIVTTAAAQEDSPHESVAEEGREVYDDNCAACHRPDGSGVPGAIPPVAGNPNVADTTYLESVIRNGLEGEIEVLGTTYDSRMAAFPGLDADEIRALIVFIQEVMNEPTEPEDDDDDDGETSTTTVAGGEPTDPGPESDRLIADGRLVYETNCSACHQLDGSGRSGAFPPLVDNQRIDDTEYLRAVVRNGLTGEIEVDGETYNGNMPAFSLLDDGQVTALVAYLQQGLGRQAPAPPPTADTGGSAGTSLPSGAVLTYSLGFLIALAAVGAVVAPMALARADGGSFTPVQTWLKSVLIVLYFVLATVVIPSKVMESGLLASPPSVAGDLISDDMWDLLRSLIGSGVWLGAFGLGVWGLRRIQKGGVI